MSRPRKIDSVELYNEPTESVDAVENKAPIEQIASDGKVAVKKNGVTRRILPEQVKAWALEGWK